MTVRRPCSGIRLGTESALSSSAVVTLSCSVHWCAMEPRLARCAIVIVPAYALLSRYTGHSCPTTHNWDNYQGISSTARRQSVSSSIYQILCNNNAFPRAKLDTAYRTWPRHTGGVASRAQHRGAALGTAEELSPWQWNVSVSRHYCPCIPPPLRYCPY